MLIVLKSARSAPIGMKSVESMRFVQHRGYIFSTFFVIWQVVLGGAEGCFFKHPKAQKAQNITICYSNVK
jgi:hypothetical protein